MKTPIRHGDWHLIDGQLIDMSQSPDIPTESPPKAVTGSDVDGESLPPSLPPIPPAPNKRRKSTSED